VIGAIPAAPGAVKEKTLVAPSLIITVAAVEKLTKPPLQRVRPSYAIVVALAVHIADLTSVCIMVMPPY
jgi:hypothetical protein